MPIIIEHNEEKGRVDFRMLKTPLIVVLWFVFGIGPIIILMAGFIFGGDGIEPEALPNLRRFSLLLNSAFLAVGVSVFCTITSILAVSSIERFPSRCFRRLLWIPLIMIAVPPFVHVSAWIEAGRLFNTGVRLIGLPAFTAPSWLFTAWVQSMAFIPVAFGFCLVSMNRVEHAFIEAGRISANAWQVFYKIRLPLAFPIILIGSGLVALQSLADFSIPAIFQIPSYALEVFVTCNIGANEKTALLVAMPLFATCIIVILILLRSIRYTVTMPLSSHASSPTHEDLPVWFKYLQTTAIVIFVMQFCIPLVMLLAQVGSFAIFFDTIQSASQVIRISFINSLTAAVGSVGIGFLLMPLARNNFCLFLFLLPLAFPASLTGIGLIKLWNHPDAGWIYGGSLMPALAAIARFSPISILVLYFFDRTVASDLADAARLFSGNGPARWKKIMLPLYAPGLMAAFFIVFALALGELPATLMVAPPGGSTLSMRIYNLLHYGNSQGIAGLCLFSMAVTTVMATLFLVTIAQWKNTYDYCS